MSLTTRAFSLIPVALALAAPAGARDQIRIV